jgi:hypothetical protein
MERRAMEVLKINSPNGGKQEIALAMSRPNPSLLLFIGSPGLK